MAQRPYPVITVNEKAARSLRGGHPWVYGAETTGPDRPCENGDLVDVVTQKGRWLGTGFLNDHSKIRVRLISRNTNDKFDAAFWRRRLQYALDYRAVVMGPDVSASRLIFGEADQFPGLTVDLFHDVLVTEVLSLGMEKIKHILYPQLVELLADRGIRVRAIYERNEAALREKEGLPREKGFYPLPGLETDLDGHLILTENGIKYDVDYIGGQKTGFFLDQKYNRRAAAALMSRQTGAGLLHPHRGLCPELRPGGRRPRHRGGYLPGRGGADPPQRFPQRPGGQGGRRPGGRVRPAHGPGQGEGASLRLHHPGPSRLYQKRRHGEKRLPGVQGD